LSQAAESLDVGLEKVLPGDKIEAMVLIHLPKGFTLSVLAAPS
jgi:hypothetical protein